MDTPVLTMNVHCQATGAKAERFRKVDGTEWLTITTGRHDITFFMSADQAADLANSIYNAILDEEERDA